MKFKFITPNHAYYPQELMLRWEVLRKPLGLPPGSEVFDGENESVHLIAMEDKKIVGCVLFHPESKTSGRISQLALSEEYRGRGFGRKLLATLERFLSTQGYNDLYLYAREDLQSFYAKAGYQMEGDPILRLGSFHRVMKKTLLSVAA